MLALTLALALSLAATPAPLRLASTGFSSVNVDEKNADFFAEFFAQQLQQRGVQVTTKSAVAAVVGLERQKQLLGCSAESNTCLAELAGALGVDGLIVGSLAKFSGEYVVNLKVVSAKNGNTLVAESVRIDSDRGLLDWFTQLAARWAPALLGGKSVPMPPPPNLNATRPTTAPPPEALAVAPAPPKGPPGPWPWIWAGTGGALLVGSAVSFGMAKGVEADLRSGAITYGSVDGVTKAAGLGSTWQGVSALMLLGGVIAGGVGGYQLLTSGGSATAAITPVPGGAVLSVVGVLP